MDWSKLFATGLATGLVVALVLSLNAFLVMLCWNTFLIVAINGVNEISFITAMGITGLCGILFNDNGIKVNQK